MSDATIAAILGGIAGAVVSGAVAIFVALRQRKQTYYSNLIKFFEAHNWKLLEHKLDPGITVNAEENKVSVVCYQHLNLLFFAWQNRSIIKRDGSLDGWKNWVAAISDGANEEGRETFNSCYRQILNHGDLYPKEFINWLEEKLEFSVKCFPEVRSKPSGKQESTTPDA